MGVAGAGKSTIGRRLASALAVPFIEGDDLHSASAVRRMAAGEPLDDDDRRPWLHRLNDALRTNVGTGCVLACSALRRSYREQLSEGLDSVVFLALVAPPNVLESRLTKRQGHFAEPQLLPSQLATLELGDDVLSIDANRPIDDVVEDAARRLAR
jgi:gluconokinase